MEEIMLNPNKCRTNAAITQIGKCPCSVANDPLPCLLGSVVKGCIAFGKMHELVLYTVVHLKQNSTLAVPNQI